MNVDKLMLQLEHKHPGEVEYLQAVREVLESIEDIYNQNPQFEAAGIIERIVEPDRIFFMPGAPMHPLKHEFREFSIQISIRSCRISFLVRKGFEKYTCIQQEPSLLQVGKDKILV